MEEEIHITYQINCLVTREVPAAEEGAEPTTTNWLRVFFVAADSFEQAIEKVQQEISAPWTFSSVESTAEIEAKVIA